MLMVLRLFIIKAIVADDLKIVKCIKTDLDATHLQHDLKNLSSWCSQNYLDLNISKCKIMTNHRTKMPIIFQYNIEGISVDRVYEIRDLGVLFNVKLSFVPLIHLIISKAYSLLGFQMRICSEFFEPLVLRSLFFTHARNHLEYASIVWLFWFF